MTLTELRYIVMLARERHFGRAAVKCHVSQPTLSIALKKFEQRHGAILFERSSADVRLTAIGEQIALQAERVLEEAGRIKEIAAQGKDPLIGSLRLGVIYSVAPYLLPRLMPAMHILAPQMPVYLQENFTVRLAEQLHRGELDVIVVALPFSEPGIVSRPVYDDPYCIIVPKGHPMTRQAAISPDQVAAENLLLLGNGNCFRDQVVQACPNLSKPGGTEGSLDGSSLETVRYMVASGAGISVVPVSAAESWPQNEPPVQFCRFTEPAPFRRIVIAWRVSFPRVKAIDVLRAAIIDSPPAGVSVIR